MIVILILAKAVVALMLGFTLLFSCGIIYIPFLKKIHIDQMVNREISERHLVKEELQH